MDNPLLTLVADVESFTDLWDGSRTAYILNNPKGVHREVLILFRENDPLNDQFTGRELLMEVTDVRRGVINGLQSDAALISLRRRSGRDNAGQVVFKV